MKRKGLHLFATLAFLLYAATTFAQQWTVFELPAKKADVPQLIQQQFGCTYQELPEKHEISHLRITGTDFYREDSDRNGREAIAALVRKAKVLDLSGVKDNEESIAWYDSQYYYDYPGPSELLEEISNASLDSIQHFIFPKTLTVIPYGFGNSKTLRQVTWPDHVTQLAWAMFHDCTSLREIAIPEGVTELPQYCFQRCSSLTSVTLPSTLKTFNDDVFRSCSALEAITIPDGVETIGSSCFLYCTQLQKVTLPQSITQIGGSMFNGCEKLASVTLPRRVKTIGDYMFYSCKALTNIVLPDSAEAIGSYAFADCTSLKRVTLPTGLTTIGPNAFYASALEELDMPDAVTTLDQLAFYECKQLRRVHLSRGLTTIPTRTFSECQLLEEVNIPMRVKRIEAEAFKNCHKLSAPVLPEGLTHIDEAAFWDTRFEHITLPSTLQVIGRYCFRYSHLSSVDVPANVVEICQGAFQDCGNLRHATLPDGLLYLQADAFNSCVQLEDVALPAGLRYLGGWVFNNNPKKKTFVLPPLINEAPDHICNGCESLESVTLHKGVTAIHGNAFYGCSKLTHIDLPEGLTLIGDWAFCRTPLKEVHIPSSVRRIENRAFNEGAYTRVVVPEGVEFIGERAFYSPDLRYVDFPSTVAQMEQWAFQGDGPACDSIVLRAPVPPACWGSLYRSWLDGALYVPAASLNAYQQHKTFSEGFVNIKPLTGYSPANVVVATPMSTDSVWFPVVNNADLTIAYNPYSSNGFYSGHLHVGEKVKWPVGHLRYDYRLGWYGWDEQTTGTLINEGVMTAQSMEMNLEFKVDRWFFFTPPFDMKAGDLTCSDPRTPFVLRTFSGSQRAAGNHQRVWQDVPADATLQAGRGYILQYGTYRYASGTDAWTSSSDDVTFHLQASSPLRTLSLSAEDVTIPLEEYKGEFPHNEGWNLIGNPFMAYFDIREIDTDGPIVVADKEPYTSFEVFSPLDDDFILHPLRAFLVQRSAAQPSITFHSAGRQADRVVRHEAPAGARAVRRAALRRQRLVFDALLQRHAAQGDSLLARTRIVQTPRATERYDRGQDAPFLTMNDDATALYSRTGGLRYSLNELPPVATNVEIGMHLQEAGTCTLAVNMRGDLTQAPQQLWLTDLETGIQTDLLDGTYTFTVAEPCTLNNRFVLQLAGDMTAVQSPDASPVQDDAIYDLQGRRIAHGKAATRQLPRGLYIKNGKIIHY